MSGKRSTVLKLSVSAIGIAALIAGAYLLMRYFGITDLTREELQAYIEGTGAIAPLIYILISFVQVTFIPIPGAVTIIAGNYVFGTFKAFLYSYIGMMAGSILAYWLGRWIGRPFVNWIAGGTDKVDSLLARLKGRENVLLFYMFFLPLFPDDLLCSLAGIIPTKPMTFFIIQLVTRFTSIGATMIFMSGEVQGWAYAVCVGIAILSVPIFVYCYKNAEKVCDAFIRLGRKIFHRNKRSG